MSTHIQKCCTDLHVWLCVSHCGQVLANT